VYLQLIAGVSDWASIQGTAELNFCGFCLWYIILHYTDMEKCLFVRNMSNLIVLPITTAGDERKELEMIQGWRYGSVFLNKLDLFFV